MGNKLRWGILGTGRIARTFAGALKESQTGELAAVGSRSRESAAHFAAETGARVAHGSYDALLADASVDAVYIAAPHPMHAEWAVRAAAAGKHILCEKPLAVNHSEAAEIVDAARRNDVFLMEAFMYRCHPQTTKLVELLREGAIGEVQFLKAKFSFRGPFDQQSRIFNHALGGGGILDVGCYPMSMARLVAGAACGRPFDEPSEIRACGNIGPQSRVDETAVASLKFPSGMLAQIACGITLATENNVRIWGTEGSIIIPSPWVIAPQGGFTKIIIFKDGLPAEVVVDADRGLYTYEADHVAAHIADRQAPAMTWEDSLGNMRALDTWRAQVGLRYEFEKA
jgi:predicted dehydrogenase